MPISINNFYAGLSKNFINFKCFSQSFTISENTSAGQRADCTKKR